MSEYPVNVYEFAKSNKIPLGRVRDFSEAVNPLGMSNKAKHALQRGVKNLSRYPDPGMERLKRYIAGKEGVTPGQILPGHGATHILRMMLNAVGTGEVAVPWPLSPYYEEILRSFPVRPRMVRSEQGRLDPVPLRQWRESVAGCSMVVLPYPHDVSGAAPPLDDIVGLSGMCRAEGACLIVDEAYRDFTGLPSAARQAGETPDNAAVFLRTFSTFHGMAGLRVGYAIGQVDWVAGMEPFFDPRELSSLTEAAAIASLRDKGFKRRTSLFIDREKGFIRKMLGDGAVTVHDGPANMLLLELRAPAERLREHFGKYRVLVHTFADGRDAFVRMPVKRHVHNAYFVRVLKKYLVEG